VKDRVRDRLTLERSVDPGEFGFDARLQQRLMLSSLLVSSRLVYSKGSNGTWLYSAPEVTKAAPYQSTMHTSRADSWSWGAVLYRMTYMAPPEYDPPCHHPRGRQPATRDPNLIDVLRHTLVIEPRERVEPTWLAQHPYTKTP
jgi:serine/threonine protein kinase